MIKKLAVGAAVVGAGVGIASVTPSDVIVTTDKGLTQAFVEECNRAVPNSFIECSGYSAFNEEENQHQAKLWDCSCADRPIVATYKKLTDK